MPLIEEIEDSEGMSTPPTTKLTDEERNQLADKLDKELDDFINVLAEKSVGYFKLFNIKTFI